MDEANLDLIQAMLLGRAVDEAPIAVSLWTTDVRLGANRFLCDLLGFTREEFLRFPPGSQGGLSPGDRRARELESEAVGSVTGEIDLTRSDGTIVRCSYIAVPVEVDGAQAYLTFLRPVAAQA